MVLQTIRNSLAFLSWAERARYYLFLFLRATVGMLDLIGILAIGFLATSIALFITLGSDPSRVVELSGIAIPAVTAQSLPIVSVAILGLFLVKALLSILLTRSLANFLALIEARAARKVAQAVFGIGLRQARKYSREDIYYAVQAGSPAAFNSLLNFTGVLVAEGTLFFLILVAFLFINPLAALVTIIYFGLVAWIMQVLVGKGVKIASERVKESTIAANTNIGDLSEALKEAAVMGKREFFLDRIYEARVSAASNSARQFVLSGLPRYVVETALILGVSIFVLYQAIQGDLVAAAGTLGVFLSGGLRLTASLLPLQNALLSIKSAIPAAEKAHILLGESVSSNPKETLSEVTRTSTRHQEPARVKIANINFSYPNQPGATISNLSMIIEPGEQVALIGESGAGKSTIAELILGLLTPDSGHVLINGKLPSDLALTQPGYLGYVPQKPGLISGTIETNIAFGVPPYEIDSKRMSDAIESAHLNEVIISLPDGIETDIGKRKDELSGGQLQRIGLARALYSQPGLLVLDEATSALDVESENEIKSALQKIRGKVTVILIAHRLNLIQDTEKVFLIKKGSIVESGKFAELAADKWAAKILRPE